jgi:hypothetical protein
MWVKRSWNGRRLPVAIGGTFDISTLRNLNGVQTNDVIDMGADLRLIKYTVSSGVLILAFTFILLR